MLKKCLMDRQIGNWRKSLKNQTYDVIKMREMRGQVGKKTPKKDG